MNDSGKTEESFIGSSDRQSQSNDAKAGLDFETAKQYVARLARKAKTIVAKVRERPLHETVRDTTNNVTAKFERAGSYLEEGKYQRLMYDLVTLVRKHPVRSLLVIGSLGVFLARRTKG